MKSKVWMLGLIALAGNGAAAEFDFAPYVARATGSWAEAVTVGDVNADGRDDIVLATGFNFDAANDFKLYIYFQLPDGSLSAPAKQAYSAFTNSVAVALGDMNNDGVNDIVVGHDGGLTLFTATSNGTFVPHGIAADRACPNIGTLDIDMDGNTDMVCQSWDSDAYLYYGNGASGVASSSFLATGANGYNDMKIGDVTGDGLPDIVMTSAQAFNFFVYPHNGHGFGTERPYPKPSPESSLWANAIGDFNGDGRKDIVVAGGGNSPASNIWLYLQNAQGGLGAPVQIASLDMPEALAASDLDKDGRQDIVAGHRSITIGRYMQAVSGVGAELVTSNGSFNGTSHSLATGDIDDDGCTDVVVADYGRGLLTYRGMNCNIPEHDALPDDDFNGDGKSDLFWRNIANGANAIWRSADYATPQVVTGVTNTAWSVIGTGDFNGDRKADLLWHNPVTGTNAIWRSANQATPQPVTQITDPLWKIVGVGDFDGDGKHDLLWRHGSSGRNAIWKSANFATQRSVTTLADTQWQVAGVGDFDADGRDDILWHNPITRSNMTWPSGDFWKQRYLTKVTNPAWGIAGIGDFDGDKHSDILWRDTMAGVNAIWKHGYYSRQQAVSTLPGSQWQVVATGDYDGDGRHDVAWRNSTTGENVVWKSANAHTPLDITDITNLQWRVQP